MRDSKRRARLTWQAIREAIENGAALPAMFQDAAGIMCLAEDNGGGFFGKQLPAELQALLAEKRPELIAFAYWARIAGESAKRLATQERRQ